MRSSGKIGGILVVGKAWMAASLLCILVAPALAQEVSRDLTKESEVEAYLDELTGFGSLKGITKSFARVDVNDDNTPFLHTQINGKKNVWRAEIRNFRLKLKSGSPGYKDKYVRNFEVLVDPNGGHLLRVTSTFDGNDPDMLPEPPAEVAEAQFRRMKEVYHGFPATPPKISLIDALDAVGAHGIGSPFVAKEIYAVYVMHSEKGAHPRPVWAITLRGIPYRHLIGKPLHLIDVPDREIIPTWRRNRIRNIVDAVTGQVLFATSRPRPLPPKKKENGADSGS
jgi:hypothetical protein